MDSSNTATFGSVTMQPAGEKSKLMVLKTDSGFASKLTHSGRQIMAVMC